MLKLIENFLPEDYQREIEDLMLSNCFGWFYYPSTASAAAFKDKNTIETYHLTHAAFADGEINSSYYELLYGVLSYLQKNADIEIKELLRIKCNFTVPVKNFTLSNYSPIHVDGYSDDLYSFLYYVNDSDGDTRFFDDNFSLTDSHTPKRGTGVLFNSGLNHAGSCPVDYDKRLVINYVFRI